MTPDLLSDQQRLDVLRSLQIMETPPEQAYDDIARLASVACRSSIASLNFVDSGRHWTKAAVGVAAGGSVAADLSFCAATVESEAGLLVVPDTHADPEWRDHPLVSGKPKLGYYAGAAIVVADQPVAVICIWGSQPRPIGENEVCGLRVLARQAAAQLELRRANCRLHDMALTDSLTGLANRVRLIERLDDALVQRARVGGEVGVLLCDLDGFKAVNDTHGHAVGDELLRQVAGCLRLATRSGDTVARLAGDEFVVVCSGLTGRGELAMVVERIRFVIDCREFQDGLGVGLSVGAVLARDGENANDVLVRADAAMYEQKVPSAR